MIFRLMMRLLSRLSDETMLWEYSSSTDELRGSLTAHSNLIASMSLSVSTRFHDQDPSTMALFRAMWGRSSEPEKLKEFIRRSTSLQLILSIRLYSKSRSYELLRLSVGLTGRLRRTYERSLVRSLESRSSTVNGTLFSTGRGLSIRD